MTNFEAIIGLEIHVELKTKSKMFCGCRADWFGHEPNTFCCPVCLGLPGALPVPNKKAVEWCVMLGMALNCEIPDFVKFDRKNYFYPDLPKGYQISQYDRPFCINGWLEVPLSFLRKQEPNKKKEWIPDQVRNDSMRKRIRIRRVHLEEDTGKLIHATVDGKKCTLIDFNRSGVPLVEIVTEPDIRSSHEARVILKKLHQIIRYLGISDADMEKGSMRLEPNISVKIKDQRSKIKNTDKKSKINEELPKYKVEVKNINSFAFAKKAIDFEIARHTEILKRGEIPVQETRGWDEKKGITYSQRSKEEAHDYRYFPEPDIPPIRWIGDKISKIKDKIGELPDEKIERFMREYMLSEYDATVLTDEKSIAEYFEKSIQYAVSSMQYKEIKPKTVANWIINKKIDASKVSPEELLKLISQQNQKARISDEELEKVIKRVIETNPKAVSDYKFGKPQAIMFLVGQVMRETKGKASAQIVKNAILKLL